MGHLSLAESTLWAERQKDKSGRVLEEGLVLERIWGSGESSKWILERPQTYKGMSHQVFEEDTTSTKVPGHEIL